MHGVVLLCQASWPCTEILFSSAGNRALPCGLFLFQDKGQELPLLSTAPKSLQVQLLFSIWRCGMAFPQALCSILLLLPVPLSCVHRSHRRRWASCHAFLSHLTPHQVCPTFTQETTALLHGQFVRTDAWGLIGSPGFHGQFSLSFT